MPSSLAWQAEVSVDFAILGPLRVLRDGADLELGGAKPRALLALLALHPGTAISTDRIIDVLWGDAAPRQALASLQVYVSNLRRLLEPARPPRAPATLLVTRGDGYLLDVDPARVDAVRFAAHARAAREGLRAHHPETALAEAEAALTLWRGRPVPELGDDSSIIPERVRLEELRIGLREDRAEAALAIGLPVAGDLETLIAEDRLRERPWALLLQALERDGRVAEALERYQAYRTILDEELGLEPGRAMQDLQRQLLAGEPARASDPGVADEPVVVQRVHNARRGTTSAEPRPIAGRRSERRLLERFVHVRTDAARWALILGEAGIGKTTLAGHLASVASAAGHQVAWARCPEDLDAPPYWPISELLNELGLPALVDLSAASEPLDDRARTFRLFEAVAEHLERASRSAPILLVIDDLQWADPATARLLAHVVTRLRHAPILIAATLRAEEVTDDLEPLLVALAREAASERLEIGPMQVDELRELAAQLGTELAEHDVGRLGDRSSGNPFFATELLRLPTDEWASGEDASVPPGIGHVVRKRLRRLGPDAVDVLRTAAGIGLEFDLPLLVAASGARPDDVLDRVDEAMAANLLAGASNGRLRFTHALVRDTLTSDLTLLGRQRLHARLGDALSSLPNGQGRLGELARHRLGSVPITGAAAAVEAALAAARDAREGLAAEQAVVWLTAALEVVENDPALSRQHEGRYELHLERGQALLVAGRTFEAWTELCQAFDHAAERKDLARMATAMNALRMASGSWNWVPFQVQPLDVIARIQAALDTSTDGGTDQEVQLLVTLAEGTYFVDPHRSATLAAEAVELARAKGCDADLADAIIGHLVCTVGREAPGTQLERLDAFEAIPGERPPPLRAHAALHRWRALTELGDRARADEALAAAERLARLLPLPAFRAELGWARLTHRVLRNDLGGIEDELEEAAEFHRRVGLYADREFRAMQLILMRWWQGRVGGCAETLGREVAHASVLGPEFSALILLGQARTAEARSLLQGPLPDLPEDWTAVTVACLRAWVAVESEVPEAALASLELLDPHRTEIAVFGTGASVGPVGLYTGLAHAAHGHTRRAEQDLRIAVGHAEHGTAGPWGTLARVELARFLSHSADPGPEPGSQLAIARREAARSGSDDFARFVERRTGALDRSHL